MRKSLEMQLTYVTTLLKWVVLACSIGVLVGVVGASFHIGITVANQLMRAHRWLLWLLPAGGVAIILVYRLCGMELDKGTNLVLVAVRNNEPIRLRTAPLIFSTTILTHLLGGSAGREGAALQLGGAIASSIGHKAKCDSATVRTMVVCGMSAAFASMFGTPLAAAFFAMEVVHVGVMHYSTIVPAMLAALVAVQVAGLFPGGAPAMYLVSGVPALSPLSLLQAVLLGAVFAVVAILFYETVHTATRLNKKFLPKPLLRVAVGGVLVIVLTLLVGTYDYNGAGTGIISAAIGGSARPEAFALKILFTAVTLGAGFKGGEVTPIFFTGATCGCVVGPLLGLDPSFSAAMGMTAVFCGVTNCPITSILLSFELFGGEGLALFAVCCAVAYMLSGHGGMYSEQEIVYSKLRPEAHAKKELQSE